MIVTKFFKPFKAKTYHLSNTRHSTITYNLSFGFLSSESTKIHDEIEVVSSKRIAAGTILEKKQPQDHVKIVDAE